MERKGCLIIASRKIEIDQDFVRLHGYGKPGSFALISVSDTGCGMDRETQEKIFEPFFTTKEVGHGTGLGLSMAYGIVKQHEGYINVYSEPGKGTTFNIYLPLVAAEQNLIVAWRSGRPESMRAAVARLMQLDDPLLWTQHRLYHYVAQFDPEAKKSTGIFLNGKVYTQADRQTFLEVTTALELGFCDRNLPCALDDELKIVCAGGGDCADDRYKKAKNLVLANGGTEDNWKSVLVLVNQIEAALASRNVSFFVR